MKKRWATWKVQNAWTLDANPKEIGLAQFTGRDGPMHYVTEDETDELLGGDPKVAEERARKALADPSDMQARLLLGGALRKQKRFAEAQSVLEPLSVLMPHKSLVWQELGLTLATLGEREKAINAYMRAIDLRYQDRTSWFRLGDLLDFESDGSTCGSGTLHSDANFLRAKVAYDDEKYTEAEAIARELLKDHPDDPEIMRLLADSIIRAGQWPKARELYERCVEIAPDSHSARFRLATMAFAMGHYELALPHIDQLLEHDQANKLYRGLRAVCLCRLERYEAALLEFESFIDTCDEQPGLWTEYARVLKVQRPGDLMRAFESAIRIVPTCVEAYVAAAFTKSIRLDEEFAARSVAQAARSGSSYEDRARLHFAAGKAFEDLKRYPESFEHYRLSNEILCTSRDFGPEASAGYKIRMKRFFKPRFLRDRAGWGCEELGPIFVLGMPRAGSTLVEQILSSHPMIEALGELNQVGDLVKEISPKDEKSGLPPFPIVLRQLDAERIRALGEQYMERTRRLRKSGKPYFTDKMPGNHNHIAFINLILPNAKFIDARRNPLDCCFSNFKHYFPTGQPLSTNLRDVGRAYVDYVELMAFYEELLPGRVHRVIYEHLVEDPEHQVRQMLDYVGVPFDERCLRFHENKRIAKTISQDQVRMPLYKSGMGQWLNYEPWLGPLKEELGYVLDLYPEVPRYFTEIHATWSEPLALGQGANPFRSVKGVRQLPFDSAGDVASLAA